MTITFQNAAAWAQISTTASAGTTNLRYKIYKNAEADCLDMPDGQRVFTNLSIGSIRYVLISNVSFTDDLRYVVEVVGE